MNDCDEVDAAFFFYMTNSNFHFNEYKDSNLE